MHIARMHKDAGSAFDLTFVNLPGCVAAGETLRDLARAGIEALSLPVEGMVEDGELIPQPTGLDADTANRDNDPRLPILLIEVATTSIRTVRVNVTLLEDVVRDIDRAGSNRSRFLAEAARTKLPAA